MLDKFLVQNKVYIDCEMAQIKNNYIQNFNNFLLWQIVANGSIYHHLSSSLLCQTEN